MTFGIIWDTLEYLKNFDFYPFKNYTFESVGVDRLRRSAISVFVDKPHNILVYYQHAMYNY